MEFKVTCSKEDHTLSYSKKIYYVITPVATAYPITDTRQHLIKSLFSPTLSPQSSLLTPHSSVLTPCGDEVSFFLPSWRKPGMERCLFISPCISWGNREETRKIFWLRAFWIKTVSSLPKRCKGTNFSPHLVACDCMRTFLGD